MAEHLLQVLYHSGRFSDLAFLIVFPINNPVKRAKTNHGESAKTVQELVKFGNPMRAYASLILWL